MRSLLCYMKDYKKESVLGPLFKLLEASFELFVPLVIAKMVDQGIRQGSAGTGEVWKYGGILLALAFIGMVCSVTAQFFAAKAATGFATKLRHALFSHIQSLSFTEMDVLGTSTMITRMTSDVNQVQNGVNLVLRLFLRSPFIVFGAMIMAFTIDVRAALLFLVIIPLLSLVVFGIMWLTIPMYKKVQGRLDKVLGLTRQNLTGVRVIRAFNKQEEEEAQFSGENLELMKTQLFVGRISALMNPLTYVLINVALVLLLRAGAIRIDSGILTQGEVVALVNYMSQILVELIKLANLIVSITKALACAGRIESVFQIKPSLTEKDNPNIEETEKKEVTFSHVYFRYKNAAGDALSDIDFSMKQGETMGIIGGTGSGKTSLVNLIPRFYDVREGAVLIHGRDVRGYSLEDLRKRVGMVMQETRLFHGSIRANLSWGREGASDAELWEALTLAQAKEFVEKKEGQLDFVVEQGGKNLSGGQRQRLNIARALVRQPEILILDDSASALDYATDAALRKAIREMKGTPMVFIVSQRAASVMHADKIMVLEDGEIAGFGNHNELLNTCEIYQEIYYSQFQRKEAGHEN